MVVLVTILRHYVIVHQNQYTRTFIHTNDVYTMCFAEKGRTGPVEISIRKRARRADNLRQALDGQLPRKTGEAATKTETHVGQVWLVQGRIISGGMKVE